MEACGIDVFATARAHGLEVRTLRVLSLIHISLHTGLTIGDVELFLS